MKEKADPSTKDKQCTLHRDRIDIRYAGRSRQGNCSTKNNLIVRTGFLGSFSLISVNAEICFQCPNCYSLQEKKVDEQLKWM